MLTELGKQVKAPLPFLEAFLFLFVTPFLLFPSLTTVGTLLACVGVIVIWLRPLPPTPFNLLLLLWCLMLGVGILVSADPVLTLPKATNLILGLTIWHIITRLPPHYGVLTWGLAGFALLGLGFVGLGALSTDWVFKVPFLEQFIQRLPDSLIQLPESREAGTHANQLAGTILIYWPLFLAALFAWWPSRRWLWLTTLGISMLLTGLLLLTQSRSGWLGAIGGSMVLVGLWASILPTMRRRRWLLGGLGLVAVAMMLWLGPHRVQQLWLDPPEASVVGALTSVSFRQEVWRWSLESVQDFPYTGTGLGSFRQVVQRVYPIGVSPHYDVAHAHNIFVQVALDVGVPGLLIYVALLLVAGGVGWHVAKKDEALRPFVLGLLSGLAALHIYGLTDALALGSKPGLGFWALLGILTLMHRVVSE